MCTIVQAEFICCSVFWHAYLSNNSETSALGLTVFVLVTNGLLFMFLAYSFCADRRHERDMKARARFLWQTVVPSFIRLSHCEMGGLNLGSELVRRNSMANVEAAKGAAEKSESARQAVQLRRQSSSGSGLSRKMSSAGRTSNATASSSSANGQPHMREETGEQLPPAPPQPAPSPAAIEMLDC